MPVLTKINQLRQHIHSAELKKTVEAITKATGSPEVDLIVQRIAGAIRAVLG